MMAPEKDFPEPKLCINCKHLKEHPGKWSNEIYQCYVFAEPLVDLVTGDKIVGKPLSAYGVRMNECGPEGRLYEPK